MKPTKARVLVILVPALFLCGCVTAYQPITLRIADPVQYAADLAFCTSRDTLAAKAGKTLSPTSVASLLSRLKADNILRFDGERYRAAAAEVKPDLKVVKTA